MQVNELVPLADFFTTHVAPELASPNGSLVLKADCLKFVTTFRGALTKQAVMGVMQPVVALVAAEKNVVHSYAAHCMERVLTTRDAKLPRYSSADLGAVLQQLLSNLFTALRWVGIDVGFP